MEKGTPENLVCPSVIPSDHVPSSGGHAAICPSGIQMGRPRFTAPTQ